MRKIVVTGSALGIGKALCEILRAQGHEVIGVDIANATICADLSLAEGRQSLFEAVEKLSGGTIDGLVACAGMAAGSGKPETMASVNFFGATQTAESLLPLLSRSSAPRVVLVSSEALLLDGSDAVFDACMANDEPAARTAANAAEAENLVYSGSKRALACWVKREAVTARWAGAGILLNAVAPGVVKTRMTEEILASAEGFALLDEFVPMRLGRPAEPRELGEFLAFMVSAQNSFIVGQTIFCDGGAEATLRPTQI
jgi:NAD(P)-dependent dehydrogenase (short-subunit alcohol dehydrogenase family)